MHTETLLTGAAYSYPERFLMCWFWLTPYSTVKGSKLTKSAAAGSLLRALKHAEALDAAPRGKRSTVVVMQNFSTFLI